MRMALEITIIAIILLVVAAVLIAIFVSGINNTRPWSDARANCVSSGFSICKSLGVMPPTWTTQKYTYNGKLQTCEEITGMKDCAALGVNTDCAATAGQTCKDSCDATKGELPGAGTCDTGKICCKAKT
jgi:hypothetical protein